ncbi:MAG: hypothetical protein WCP83_07880 [Actinomycetota bacterium]
MKAGLTTALSIAGVLAAGAAAYAVNSSVLSTTSSTQSAVVDSPASPVVDAVSTIPGQVVQQSIPVQSSVLNNTTTTYQVGSSGSVVIDMSSGGIAVSNVVPSAGWSSEPAQLQPNGDVKVHFVSANARIEFLSHLADGKVSVSVTSEPVAPLTTVKPTSNSTKPSVPFSGDDDHQDNGDQNKRDDD